MAQSYIAIPICKSSSKRWIYPSPATFVPVSKVAWRAYGAEVAQRGNSESARGGNPVKWLDRVPTLAGGAKGRLTPPAGAAGGGGGRQRLRSARTYPCWLER